MISQSPGAGADIVSQTADGIAVVEGVGRVSGLLLDIDRLFLVAALALVVILGVAAWRRRVPLSLRHALPRPNRIHEDAVALCIVGYFMGYLAATGVAQLIWGSLEGLPARMLTGSAAQIGGIVACLTVAGTRFERGASGLVGIGSASSGPSVGLIVVVLVVLALGLCPLVGEGTLMLILRFAPDYLVVAHPTIDALHDPQQSLLTIIALWLSATVMAPVAEELFFRGLLQTFLVNLFGRRWLAIVAASIVFGGVHLSQPHSVAALMLFGVFLGYAYERTGSLIPAILIHALFNLKTLVWDALSWATP